MDSTVPSFSCLFSQLTETVNETGVNARPGSYKVYVCLCITWFFCGIVWCVIGYGLGIWREGFKSAVCEKLKKHQSEFVTAIRPTGILTENC
jgi:hypothetical protein